MEIKENITQDQMTEFFINDPALCYLGLADLDLHRLYETKQYYPRENTKYIGVLHDGKLVSLVCIELFTEQTLTVHFYIPTILQKKGLALRVQKLLYNYFYGKYPFIIKIVTPVPSPCEHVQRCAERFGMVLEGRITKCMKWRSELVDLLMYGLEIKREDNAIN